MSKDEFEGWCEANGYVNMYCRVDEQEEPYKREVRCSFYMKHQETGLYIYVTCTSNYDWGEDNFYVERENLTQVQETITIVQNKYI